MEYTASGIFGNGTDTLSGRSRNVPKMTAGRAALVGLVDRYLRGLLATRGCGRRPFPEAVDLKVRLARHSRIPRQVNADVLNG